MNPVLKQKTVSFAYAAAVGTVCAIFLTFAARGLRPYQDANVHAETNRVLLSVLNVPVPQGVSAVGIQKLKDSVVFEAVTKGLTAYEYRAQGKNGPALRLAFAFEGQGLWGPMRGYLCVDTSLTVLLGFRVLHQEETPGLGAEIAASWFMDQFRGKSMVDESGKPGIMIAKGKGQGRQNEVDGITGSTLTCDRLCNILNLLIVKIKQEASHG